MKTRPARHKREKENSGTGEAEWGLNDNGTGRS